jgi:glucose-1-phosphate thymidylyltransferase
MKGVICAGGLATRLYPLTHATNKHLLPVYDKPMIHYPIQTLVNAGIKDIVVVTGGPHSGDFVRVLKDGRGFGADHVYYTFQDRVGGIAGAIATAEPFTDGEFVAVILGDNCTDADISEDVKVFSEGATIFLKEVPDPERFGVPTIEGDKITKITEKPQSPDTNYAVTGLYLYDDTVFDRIRGLKKSERGELEVTDLNNSYLDSGKLRWTELSGYWRDAGTFETLWEVGAFWREKGVEKK